VASLTGRGRPHTSTSCKDQQS